MATIQEKGRETTTPQDHGRGHMEKLGDYDFQAWLREQVRTTNPHDTYSSNFVFYMVNVARASRKALLDDSPNSESLPLIHVLRNVLTPVEAELMTEDLQHGLEPAAQRALVRDNWLENVVRRVQTQKLNAPVGFHAQIVWRIFELSMRIKTLPPLRKLQADKGEFVLVRPQRLRK